jgi:hypothetical protein
MECFRHPGAAAVGVCKSCGRGLCRACAAEVGTGLACRDRCEAEVADLNRIIARNKTADLKTSQAYAQTALYYGVAGGLLLIGGLLNWRGLQWMLVPAGLLLLLAAVLHYSTGRRFTRE